MQWLSVGLLLSFFLIIVVSLITYLVHRSCANPKTLINGKLLPPGSMGFPLIGETLAFFVPNSTFDMTPFFKQRIARYGSIFKTSLVGRPCIVSADVELNQFVFQQEGKLFESWYPDTFTQIFGQQNLGSLHGSMYKYLKNKVLNLVGPENLKHKLIYEIDDSIRQTMKSWSAVPTSTMDIRESTAAMLFKFAAKKLINCDEPKMLESILASYGALVDGLISFPINLPGTAYNKCLQGRRNVMRILKSILAERRSSPRKLRSAELDDEYEEAAADFFDNVLEEMEKENAIVTEDIALDLMFVLLFASYETTASALTIAVKLLSENPLVLEELSVEHDEILKRREDKNSGVTWKEYKSMTYTSQVINEILRLANIVPGIFRKTLHDIEVKGYTIPSGWGVVVCPPAVHLNPNSYPDPLQFRPSRWNLDVDHAIGGSKNFIAFGGGMRFCVGMDLSKLEMAIFLHYLVTQYRWEVMKGGETMRGPGLTFPNGFHIKLHERPK